MANSVVPRTAKTGHRLDPLWHKRVAMVHGKSDRRLTSFPDQRQLHTELDSRDSTDRCDGASASRSGFFPSTFRYLGRLNVAMCGLSYSSLRGCFTTSLSAVASPCRCSLRKNVSVGLEA